MIEFTNMMAAGLLPGFLSEHDERGAVEQLDANYQHGGGWHKFEGFKLSMRGDKYILRYPGDPEYHEVSRAQLRDETIVLFDSAWVAVIQPDGEHEIARMD